MLPLTAVFVDFENLRQGVFHKANKKLNYCFDYNSHPDLVVEFCKALLDGSKERLYRIFFYTSRPTAGHPKSSQINTFLDDLEKINHVALRQGKLVRRGNTFVQKQVDMLLGLDVADISIKKHADNVLVVGHDSDMAPALKLARINGLQASLISFTDLKTHIEPSLLKHCDSTRYFKILEIYNQVGIKHSTC